MERVRNAFIRYEGTRVDHNQSFSTFAILLILFWVSFFDLGAVAVNVDENV